MALPKLPKLTEDWWSFILGLGVFGILAGLAVVAPESVSRQVSWTTHEPADFFVGSYFWLSIPFAFFFIMVSAVMFLYAAEKKISVLGILFVFLMVVLTIFLSNQSEILHLHFGAALFSILLGMVFSNIIFRITHIIQQRSKNVAWSKELFFAPCTPLWLSSVLLDEFYIKVSLVLLALDFKQSIAILGQATIVAFIDTPILMVVISFIGMKIFRLSRDHSLTMAGAVSICGSSAANAIASTIKANGEATKYTIAVMALFTVPAIPILPIMYNNVLKDALGWNEQVGGAWIGGSVDTTGAVIASAAIIDADAKNVAAVVKMLQNCLIGPICLGLSMIMLFLEKNKTEKQKELSEPLLINDNLEGETEMSEAMGDAVIAEKKAEPKKEEKKKTSMKDYLNMLWDRFPKFVIGFFIVCILVTIMPISKYQERLISISLLSSTWFETMGFVCIGLNLRITEMMKNVGALSAANIILLYLLGQGLDFVSTGVMAYAAFHKPL